MGSEELKPCPFCGSSLIDPKGWASLDQSGPACDMCGASAENTEVWNKRAFAPTKAVADVLDERKRHVEIEGWTPEHDDEHNGGELALAASCYALASTGSSRAIEHWPFDGLAWKPKDRRRDLVRAAALIVAEVERLDRRAANSNSEDA